MPCATMLRFAFSDGSARPWSLCEWMSMNPGENDFAGGIDRPHAARLQLAPEGRDASVLDGNVGDAPRIAGAVHELPADNHEVVLRGLRRQRAPDQEKDEEKQAA